MSLFVLGTGTDVGKTVITAGLVGWLRDRGRDAVGIKPVQTGYPPDDDVGFVTEATNSEDAGVCLRYLEPALAPAVAADVEDTDLSYNEILQGCRHKLKAANPGVVEGIGGLRVPLAEEMEVIDLAADLGLPMFVVARSGLGTLNHSALTVEALERRGLDVWGVVLNDYAGETLAERTNTNVLESMIDPPVYTMPALDLVTPDEAVTAVRENLPSSVLPE
ncbi:dethiobiotin synthase [Halococcus thailandensis]|jgi:dethiobiotin synthetase|uniref:ATP-dependent dethiobiotin synthetase BioD n=1 Tax=Halococcus thailandensis JCM 13552 TaxID=1227457 RepID=M0NEC5_9EURY|nr:dethiobiotin synthase [Halococcus thailandensis]EMA55010.1 dethiobiotin synthase [Halococcus thailandensis JCM 13552]